MSFRAFVGSLGYRRQAAATLARFQALRPPANPSRRHLAGRVRRLLSADTAWFARRELELAGAAAVPAVSAAARDPRYWRAEWEPYSGVPAPLDTVLGLLVPHAADVVLAVATPLARSPSEAVRKAAAVHLASLGRAEAMPTLAGLVDDDAGYVRAFTCIGLRRAVDAGRADAAFRRAAYDLLLPQCDRAWPGAAMNDAAAAVVALDPVRAAVDLGSPPFLSPDNRQLHPLLRACNAAGVTLPAAGVNDVLDHALARSVGDDCYPHQYVAAGALAALVRAVGEAARPRLAAVPATANPVVGEAVAAALATLAGAAEPVRFVVRRCRAVGYGRLTPPQRAVLNGFEFDAEVTNGGLAQFLANGTGDRADDTLTDLRTLGLAEAVAALDSAVRLVGPGGRATDRDGRLAAFEGRGDELMAALAPLDAAYHATAAALRRRLSEYAAEHADHFRP